MRTSISLFLALIIFSLCCLAGVHCKPSFNNDARGGISKALATDNPVGENQQDGDDSQGSHICHFGHACHCAFDVPKETIFTISSLNLLSLGGSNLFYENPTIDGLVRPPIA